MADDVMNLFKTYRAIKHDKISTGILPIDILSGGGIRLGSCVALGGGEGCGKSSAYLQMTKNFIEQGRRVVYVDAEKSGAFIEQLKSFDLFKYTQLSDEYDPSEPPKLYYINSLNTYGEFQDLCRQLIKFKSKLGYEFIILDSVSALAQAKLIVGDCEASSVAYDALPISKLVKSVRGILYNAGISLFFVAQAASNIGGGLYDPQWYVKLTRAIKHTVDLLYVIEKPDYKKYKITVEGKSIQGTDTELEVGYIAKLWTIKNRVCRSQKIAVPYIYGKGIDNMRYVLSILEESKLLTKRGDVYKLQLQDRDEIKLIGDKEVHQYIRDNYADLVQMMHNSGQFDLSSGNYMLESEEDIAVDISAAQFEETEENSIESYEEVVAASSEIMSEV